MQAEGSLWVSREEGKKSSHKCTNHKPTSMPKMMFLMNIVTRNSLFVLQGHHELELLLEVMCTVSCRANRRKVSHEIGRHIALKHP